MTRSAESTLFSDAAGDSCTPGGAGASGGSGGASHPQHAPFGQCILPRMHIIVHTIGGAGASVTTGAAVVVTETIEGRI